VVFAAGGWGYSVAKQELSSALVQGILGALYDDSTLMPVNIYFRTRPSSGPLQLRRTREGCEFLTPCTTWTEVYDSVEILQLNCVTRSKSTSEYPWWPNIDCLLYCDAVELERGRISVDTVIPWRSACLPENIWSMDAALRDFCSWRVGLLSRKARAKFSFSSGDFGRSVRR